MKKILNQIIESKKIGKKSIAILVDPDKFNFDAIDQFTSSVTRNKIDFIFVGGSLISTDYLARLVITLKEVLTIPVILFPGNSMHIHQKADALLLLSLISGRNADFLIGQHVIAAPFLKRSNLELLATGYMLIDGGKQTTVSYISNTTPLPNDKPDVAMCTALAGEMLGLKLIYLDAGSGAENPVPSEIINKVSENVELPIIVGGGINTITKAKDAISAGADIIVIGNAIEKNPDFLEKLGELKKSFDPSFA